MPDRVRATPPSFTRAASATVAIAALAMLAACASQPKAMVNKGKSTEYFAESEYGVRASPRVTTKRSRLPRGGGRDQTGKPYQVKGKWYHPREDADYHKVGAASWYGDAFHGRLTANGEIYDMTHLTAAHPTMPLPSYARVTNTANGNSVIVRVNDRGPFAGGRIIDLSKRAAEMLDYTRAGVARVEVEYIGRAPLHGQDDQYLMASYRPGGSGPVRPPAGEIPPAVMVAMNGPTPLAGIGAAAVSFPGQAQAIFAGEPVLPVFGPIGPERPMIDVIVNTAKSDRPLVLSYADRRIQHASKAFAALSSDLKAGDILASWKRLREHPEAGFTAAAPLAARGEAEQHGRAAAPIGRVELKTAKGAALQMAALHSDGGSSLDQMLHTDSTGGALEPTTVRD